MSKDLSHQVNSIVENNAELLNSVSQEIWKNPELMFEETFAHNFLSDALEKKGFTVKRQYILPTAFRAEFDTGKKGPTIAVILEYDALPKIGHACGHNLIAEAGFGSALVIKEVLKLVPDIPGKVVALGTPAEEGGGGKVELINGGAFKDIDAALMVHPSPDDHLYPPFIGIKRMTVEFFGKEAHASGFPWEGVNALDAAVMCYNSFSLLRQHIKPTCRIHAIITKGGDAANVIPGYAEMKVQFRAATTYDMLELQKRVEACIGSAAAATGCKSSFEYHPLSYEALMTNRTLAERYKVYAQKLGVSFCDSNPKVIPFMASSDMGNVSHVVPSIHPTYSIGTRAANHSEGFTAAAATHAAQLTTLVTVKSMALLALDLLRDGKFMDDVRQQFEQDLKDDVGM